jgi:hypothetical protein
MADAVGNVVNAPAGVTVSPFTTDVELLRSTGAGWTQSGVTLKPNQGVLAVGTPLVQDVTTKQYVKAATNATTIEGFLRVEVDTGSSASATVKQGNLLRRGDAKYSVIKAANGNSDLTSSAVNSLNGRLDSVRDSFIF